MVEYHQPVHKYKHETIIEFRDSYPFDSEKMRETLAKFDRKHNLANPDKHVDSLLDRLRFNTFAGLYIAKTCFNIEFGYIMWPIKLLDFVDLPDKVGMPVLFASNDRDKIMMLKIKHP